MTTERLEISLLRENDREDYFHNISSDKKVLETFICKYAESLDEFDFTPYLGREDIYAIRLKNTGKLIGIILYFDEENGACEIGYGVGSEYWGMAMLQRLQESLSDFFLRKRNVKRYTHPFLPEMIYHGK